MSFFVLQAVRRIILGHSVGKLMVATFKTFCCVWGCDILLFDWAIQNKNSAINVIKFCLKNIVKIKILQR